MTFKKNDSVALSANLVGRDGLDGVRIPLGRKGEIVSVSIMGTAFLVRFDTDDRWCWASELRHA